MSHDKKDDERSRAPKDRAPERQERAPQPERKPELDFAKLDLRVETVEERISPSETNVFDK